MKLRKIIVVLILLMVAQLLSGLVGMDSLPEAQAATSPGQLIFSLYNSADKQTVLLRYGLKDVKALKSPNTFQANLLLGLDPELVTDIMSFDPLVAAASPNYVVSGFSENRSSFNFDPSSFNFDDASSTPSALNLAHNQWAWQRTGLLTSQKANWGQAVKVAVLDTGVDYNHPELKGKVLPGYDAVTGLPSGMDVQGHGTFVAGIILQIAPDVTVIPVRVLDANGNGTMATIMNGLQYALDAGADVINLSLSSTYDFKVLHELIKVARSKGVIVVSAAGNDASGNKYYPAGYAENVSIGATDNQDFRANFSNYNGYISLSAPGVAIYSTWKGGGYGWGDGTSFSTPMAAAGAAIVKSLYPIYKPDQIRDTLKKAVDKFGIGCKCGGMGVGRLNFSKLSLG